ncbi:MAG TPA: lysophospholipid acyltransferase family protein [Gemmatimonadaceae bacterium]|nr:lysophospholipid acyltransferase family protein [Gemmatimonadaceae bacterium]
MNAPTPRPAPTLAHRAQFALLRGVVAWLSRFPLDAARRIGERIGMLGYFPLGIRRRVVVRQVAAAFPELDERQVRALARRAYSHLGRVAIETALVARLGRDGVLSLFEEQEDDFALVQRRMAEGRGVIAFTGHVGNWELAGAYLAARGIPIDAVARRMNNTLFDAYLNQARTDVGMTVVYDDEAVRRIPRAMKQGRLVGLVADQGVMGLASTFVPFFGRPAKTPRGPAVFALRYKVPILFISALLQPSGKYRLFVEEIPAVDTGDRDADVDATVARFTASLERMVRRYPEQYFWHHRRWKRQPPDTPPELREPT